MMGVISFTSDGKVISTLHGHEQDNPNYQKEKDLLEKWIEVLEDRYGSKFEIVSNSSDYTTLRPVGCLDLLRLKYGGSKWVKLFIGNELAKKLVDDPRFAEEKKKSQLYWKSILTDEDISKYFDVLDEGYSWLIEQK